MPRNEDGGRRSGGGGVQGVAAPCGGEWGPAEWVLEFE